MNRSDMIDPLASEIERLAKMHILYGLNRSTQLAEQKEKSEQIVRSQRTNVRTELDPVSRNLYGRYII